MSGYASFYCKPAYGEHVDAAIRLEPEARCALRGRLTDSRGQPVAGALALLYQAAEPDMEKLLFQTFTDGAGQFFFGPLQPDVLYLVRLYQGGLRLRELELQV